MRRPESLFLIAGVIVMAILVVGATPLVSDGRTYDYNTQSINYDANVCVTHYRDGAMLWQECDHNILHNAGKDMIRDRLILSGGGVNSLPDDVTICNSTELAAGSHSNCGVPTAAGGTFTDFVGCGLTRANGTLGYNDGDNGNWSISNTFTSTCDSQSMNVTRLTNGSNTLFASNSFTERTLATNDQLEVNWTIFVT